MVHANNLLPFMRAPQSFAYNDTPRHKRYWASYFASWYLLLLISLSQNLWKFLVSSFESPTTPVLKNAFVTDESAHYELSTMMHISWWFSRWSTFVWNVLWDERIDEYEPAIILSIARKRESILLLRATAASNLVENAGSLSGRCLVVSCELLVGRELLNRVCIVCLRMREFMSRSSFPRTLHSLKEALLTLITIVRSQLYGIGVNWLYTW